MPSYIQPCIFKTVKHYDEMKAAAREALKPLIQEQLQNLDLFYDAPSGPPPSPEKRFNVLSGRWFTPSSSNDYRKKNILLRNRDCTYESLDPRKWLFLADANTWVPSEWVKNPDGCLYNHVVSIDDTVQYYVRKQYTHCENDHILRSSIEKINLWVNCNEFNKLWAQDRSYLTSTGFQRLAGGPLDPDLMEILCRRVFRHGGRNYNNVVNADGTVLLNVGNQTLNEYLDEYFFYSPITEDYYLSEEDRDIAEERYNEMNEGIDLDDYLHGSDFDPVDEIGFMDCLAGDTRKKPHVIRTPRTPNTLYFGLELEFEFDLDDGISEDEYYTAVKPFEHYLFTPCSDGSLDYGVEFKSIPMEYHDAIKVIDCIGHDTNSDAWSHFKNRASTSGLHIHISRAALTPIQLGLMIQFMNNPNHAKVLATIGDRQLNRFCTQSKEYFDKGLKAGLTVNPKKDAPYDKKFFYRGNNHYDILNFENPSTVEFRFFRGKPDPNHIKASIEFVKCLVEVCGILGRTRKGIIKEGMTMQDFIAHAKSRKRFPHLYENLITKGIIPATPRKVA